MAFYIECDDSIPMHGYRDFSELVLVILNVMKLNMF